VQCDNEHCTSNGHCAAGINSGTAYGRTLLSVHSDDYIHGLGHDTHRDGVRVRGFDLAYKMSVDMESRLDIALTRAGV
jgi:hypothetical protein